MTNAGTIIGTLVQFQHDIIRDRVDAGLVPIPAKRVCLGRPNAPVMEADAFDLQDQGVSLGETTRRLYWSRATVRCRPGQGRGLVLVVLPRGLDDNGGLR